MLTFTYISSKYDKENLAAINLTLKLMAALSIFIILGVQIKIPQLLNSLSNNFHFKFTLNTIIRKYLLIIFFRWLILASLILILYIVNKFFVLININSLTFTFGLILLLINSFSKVMGSIVLSLKKYWISQLSDNTITFFMLTVGYIIVITFDWKLTINQCLLLILCSKIITIIPILLSIRKFIGYKKLPSQDLIIQSDKFGNDIYLTGTNIINELQKHSDLIILSFFVSTESVALYSVIMLAPFAVQVLLQVLNLHQTNDLINNFNINKNVNFVFKKSLPFYSTATIISICYSIVIFFIMKKWLLDTFTYNIILEGLIGMSILLVAQIINLATGFSGLALNLCKLEKQHFKITFFSFILFVFLAFILIPEYNLIGLTISILLFNIINNGWKFLLMKNKLINC